MKIRSEQLIAEYYTPELLEIVKHKYKQDFDLFGLDPDRYPLVA